MSVLEQVQQAADEHGLRFVLIGGFAVIEHGYARLTADIDLLVLRDDQRAWRDLLDRLGYQLLEDGANFQQYRKRGEADWPLDLMFARQETLDGMIGAARRVTVQGANVLLVSLEHLIALKLHVLKQARLHRFLKDFQDVVELVRINKVDLHSKQIHDLFLRYGTTDLYEKVLRAVEK
jgi:predicted nucleotidyltransferase